MDLIKKRKLDENGVAQTGFDSGPNKLTLEDARKIIEPFSHEQLLEIVQNAAVRHLDVLDAVRSVADPDHAKRKLFIRGLGWDTTTEKLRALFSTYGDLDEAIVVLDKATGKSKGFGFITFKHVDGALLALKEPSKKIDGRIAVTQFAAAGLTGQATATTANPQAAVDVLARKIYVANVPYEMPAERLLAHFSSYGEIEEGPLGFDKATGKSKGWTLFVYKTPEAARASLVDPIKTIDGHQLNCKFAIDGKKGKPGMASAAGVAQGPTGVPVEPQSNGLGLQSQSSVSSNYGGPGGGGPIGISSYGGFSGGLPGPSPLTHSHHPLNSSLVGGPGLSAVGGGPGLSSVGGGPGLSSTGSQASSYLGVSGGYGSGFGGPYGGSHFGGPGSTGYGGAGGGLGGTSGAGTGLGLGGVGGGLGGTGGTSSGAGTGLGGSGRGSSLYGLPPSSIGMPSGGYPKSAHYSLSGYQSLHNQMAEASPVPRGPPGGMYQGMPPYY